MVMKKHLLIHIIAGAIFDPILEIIRYYKKELISYKFQSIFWNKSFLYKNPL